MMNATETTKAWWDNAATIENCGGCRECARFAYGGGHADAACERHVVAHRRAAVRGMRAIFEKGNFDLFLRAVEKANRLFFGQIPDLWALAMTLKYGPTGLHPSRCHEDGTPTAETLEMPSVASAMARAKERVPNYLASIDRDVTRFAESRGVKE